MRKVREGAFDATVLALAGLRRLAVAVAPEEILPAEVMLPAPGQGALAVQCRASDASLRARLAPLEDGPARLAVTAERALLRSLGASCELALGALATLERDRLTLCAALAQDGGIRRARAVGDDPLEVAARVAAQLAPVAHAV